MDDVAEKRRREKRILVTGQSGGFVSDGTNAIIGKLRLEFRRHRLHDWELLSYSSLRY